MATDGSGPYRDAAAAYRSAGWDGVLPLPAGKKAPVPTGWTGHQGAWPSTADIHAWIDDQPTGNVALRMPPGVLGVDVDAYGGKPGAATLALLMARCGPLPATWISTSRDGTVSGIRLYRVPDGRNWPGQAGPGIELIQTGHRYLVAAPSVHPEGRAYRWVNPDGADADTIPKPTDLTELPTAWVDELARGYDRTEPADLGSGQVSQWLNRLRDGDPCRPVTTELDTALAALSGGRHDVTRDGLRCLLGYGGEGHTGVHGAITTLMKTFLTTATDTSKPGARATDDATAEWNRLLTGGVRIAAATHPEPATECDCVTDDDLHDLAGDTATSNDEQPPPVKKNYFGKHGLLAATLACDVIALGPLAEGADNRTWTYTGGIWRPAPNIIRDRAGQLLGQMYRRGHTTNTADLVHARIPHINCDPIPDIINFRNGLLDWRTRTLRPHDPAVLTTVQLTADYTPDAVCPMFERFLADVVPADMLNLVWELIGYLMFNGNPLHKAVMFDGTGRNGKGTLLRALVALLGRANITTVSLHDLVNTRFSTASLFGKLANIAGDIDATYLESTATFKAITGGDTISAEHKGRDRFDFTPWAVPVFSANKIPAAVDTSTGYLSRWLVVPFPNDFTGREDRGLDTKLHTELAGIAARGIRALPELLDRGEFILTASARDARDAFIRDVDQVRTWLHDSCDLGDEHPFIDRTILYAEYKAWAARDGHRPVRAGEFYNRLRAGGGWDVTIKGSRGFKRVKVIDHAAPYATWGL